MSKYPPAIYLFFVPFMLTGGVEKLQEGGWPSVWGVCEIALGISVSVYVVKKMCDRRKRRSRRLEDTA